MSEKNTDGLVGGSIVTPEQHLDIMNKKRAALRNKALEKKEDNTNYELEEVRKEYEEKLGKKPHGRSGIETLRDEIKAFEEEQEEQEDK